METLLTFATLSVLALAVFKIKTQNQKPVRIPVKKDRP